MMEELEAPFPWFGGKRRVADEVWARFGKASNYVEPFFGSGAVLLNRPRPFDGYETINDKDGFVANFWRAIKAAPEETAKHAENPINENDLHARHAWLVGQTETLCARLEGDPEYFDPKIAGWWVWGLAVWIGSGWCSGRGPWHVDEGKLIEGGKGKGVSRQRPNVSWARGVSRQRPQLYVLQGINGKKAEGRLSSWFQSLADRLANVRVVSGDWSRVCGPSVTFKLGVTGVFLDPPYAAEAGRDPALYRTDSLSVAHAVRKWAIKAGKRPDMRIALCGYEGEHEMPDDWAVYSWASCGLEGQAKEQSGNCKKERIWFSPACLSARQLSLFPSSRSPVDAQATRAARLEA
jgi:DNA adenine methylase